MEQTFVIGIIAIAVVVLCIASSSSSSARSNVRSSTEHTLLLEDVLEQIKQWVLASKQDSQILLSLLHINTALSQLSILHQLVGTSTFMGTDLDVLKVYISTQQRRVLDKFHEQAPNIALPRTVSIDKNTFL
jgi:hypothetical protein